MEPAEAVEQRVPLVRSGRELRAAETEPPGGLLRVVTVRQGRRASLPRAGTAGLWFPEPADPGVVLAVVVPASVGGTTASSRHGQRSVEGIRPGAAPRRAQIALRSPRRAICGANGAEPGQNDPDEPR